MKTRLRGFWRASEPAQGRLISPEIFNFSGEFEKTFTKLFGDCAQMWRG
jgi:hypothetical protein